MSIVQCKNSHYYDDERYSECPHCAEQKAKGTMEEESATVAFAAQQVENYAIEYIRQNAQNQQVNINPAVEREASFLQNPKPYQTPYGSNQGAVPGAYAPYGGGTGAVSDAYASYRGSGADPDEGKTISIYEKQGISRCIAGWLVCTKGEEYGRDFPLYAGFNRIGRSKSNDIVLRDPQVSRDEHCSVIYEEKKNIFYILPSAGNLVYVEDELLDQARQLESGKVIALGDTQLEFVAFCTGEKRWEKKV